MVLHLEELSGTVSGGSLSLTTTEHLDGMCRQVLVKPTTSSTTWDIEITDSKSFVIYNRTDCAGNSSEILSLPLKGQYTVAIANASVNELFSITLVIMDQ